MGPFNAPYVAAYQNSLYLAVFIHKGIEFFSKQLLTLISVGSGSVSIPDYHKYPLLGEPIADDPARSGPLFEASWTHALHCVSFTHLHIYP